MKVLIVHRRYRERGGEDVFLEDILIPSLKKISVDHELAILPELGTKPQDVLELSLAALGAEDKRPSHFEIRKRLKTGRFTHVLFNNFIPTVALDLPQTARELGIKTLMWVHNSRLACANGLLFDGVADCDLCLTQGSSWVRKKDCHRSPAKSFLYSLIYRNHRVPKQIFEHMDLFVCNSEYTEKIVDKVSTELRISSVKRVLRMPPAALVEIGDRRPETLDKFSEALSKPFYLYLGRISYEKGADLFAEMGARLPDRNFILCGDGPWLTELKRKRSGNIFFLGQVGAAERKWLFQKTEALIVPSRVKETSSLVIAESHPFGTPVIFPRGGGAEETVRWLNRTGCALDEFRGQPFQRKLVKPSEIVTLKNEFETQLKSLFA